MKMAATRSRWPLLNALLRYCRWSFLGFDLQWRWRWHWLLLHAAQVTVADGTEMMAKRIERVLTTDPGMEVIRHVDAGYARRK